MSFKTYTYKTFGQGQAILADVHHTTSEDGKTKTQAIALGMHAGGFATGGRRMIGSNWIQPLVDRDFVVVTIDYRLCPQVSLYEGPIQDTRDAFHWCRNQLPQILKNDAGLNVDGNRIVAFGNSAGGHLAMMLGLETDKPRAIFNGYGPLFLRDPFYTKAVSQIMPQLPAGPLDFDEDFLNKVYDEPVLTSHDAVRINTSGKPEVDFSQPRTAWLFGNMSRGTWVKAMGIPGQEDKVDPALHLDHTFPPTFFLHGEIDQVVDVKLTKDACEKLRACGVDAKLVVAEGMPHAFNGAISEGAAGYEEYIIKPIEFLSGHV